MDSQQTPRGNEDPVPRGSPMVKQNPQLPSGYQARAQAPQLSPRYPINSDSPGGPRPGGQPPQTLHRLDSRSSLGTGQSPYLQTRPPLGPRPLNPQGNPVQARPPNPANPQLPGARFPGSPGVRPPLGNFPGPRQPVFSPNQQPQIFYQPRNGEVRPQRPISLDSSASLTSSGSLPVRPQGFERPVAPQIIPETVITPATRNDSSLRDERLNGQPSANKVQIRQQREKMEIDSRSPTPGGLGSQIAETGRNLEGNENGTPKRRPSPRVDEDDDDDVVMDEKENAKADSSPRPGSAIDDRPESRNSIKKSLTPSPVPPSDRSTPRLDEERPESQNSHKKSVPPSPTPTERLSRPPSKISNHEPPGSSLSPSPVPVDKSGNSSRSESRQEESILDKTPERSVNDSTSHDKDQTNLRASESEEVENDAGEKKEETRSSSVASSRSPVPPKTPENSGNLSVPPSASPKSPKSPKSPVGSIKGFDNGHPRSLSPKAPSPVSPSPSSPGNLKNSDEKKKATFAEVENEKSEGEAKNDRPMTPGNVTGRKSTTPTKNERERTPGTPEGRKSLPMKRSTSGRSIKSDAGSESGTNQTNAAAPTTNGVAVSPTKKMPSKTRESNDKRSTAGSPVKSPSKSVKSLPRTPEAGPPSTGEKKKVPMNKVQVGAAPSPNLKTVRSKIGSLENASYKPGGGKVKIENRKLDFSNAQPKIAAKNDKYMPSGGDKKITQVKLQWNAKSKIGSLDNATYKPGGGDKKIETVKLDFKDKAKPKVGSKDNAKHVPGGGNVKSTSTPPKTPQDQPNHVETQKIEIKAESKIGSLDNVKHKPGGGDKKIFNDKDYLRQTGSNLESHNGSGAQSPVPSNAISGGKDNLPTSDENLNEEC